jgi:hypothetical protein
MTRFGVAGDVVEDLAGESVLGFFHVVLPGSMRRRALPRSSHRNIP